MLTKEPDYYKEYIFRQKSIYGTKRVEDMLDRQYERKPAENEEGSGMI